MSEVRYTTLLHGDCLELMPIIPENTMGAVITDPPYGLRFMDKGWDKEVPHSDYWNEMMRIAKPGANLLAFGSPRTLHHLMYAIEAGGWILRDTLLWLYGTGMPKGKNLGDGYHTTLKPGWEPIVLAMKPLDGTYEQNLAKWGTGGLNIDECRIDATARPLRVPTTPRDAVNTYRDGRTGSKAEGVTNLGRYPGNVMLDEEAAALLDEQAGERRSGSIEEHHVRHRPSSQNTYGEYAAPSQVSYGDTGGASRFYYVPKARGKLRGENNTHNTVKPLELMCHLVKLTTRKGDMILDPFAGSGTTLIAARGLERDCVGIERDEASYLQARERLRLDQ